MPAKILSTLSESLGQLKRWEKHSNGIAGETDREKFRVTFYNESVARISITRSEELEQFSYAVVAKPGDGVVDILENEHVIQLKTHKVLLLVQKDPVRFTFF